MAFRLAAFIVLAVSSWAFAQPPNGGQRGGGSPNAVLSAIDANGDHEITTEEMKNAFAALEKLDLNKDGKLSRDEIHPESGGRGDRGGPNERDGFGRRGRDGDRGGDRIDLAERLRGFDENGDGTISKAEVPERMKQVVARYDADKDGNLNKEEIEKMAERMSASRPERNDGPRGGGGPGGRQDRFDGPGGPDRRGVGGPPSADEVVKDAMAFDVNKDGMLSKTELQKFAEEHASRGPGGGRPDGGRGFGGGPRGDGNRTQRPARPE